MVATRPGDDPTPRAGEGGPRRTTAQLAADPAFTGTYGRWQQAESNSRALASRRASARFPVNASPTVSVSASQPASTPTSINPTLNGSGGTMFDLNTAKFSFVGGKYTKGYGAFPGYNAARLWPTAQSPIGFGGATVEFISDAPALSVWQALNELGAMRILVEGVEVYRCGQAIRTGTAQAGASGSITLDSGANATNGWYAGRWVRVTGGTGAGQARQIATYTGSTKVATVAPNWTTAPDATSTFEVTQERYDNNDVSGNNYVLLDWSGERRLRSYRVECAGTNFYGVNVSAIDTVMPAPPAMGTPTIWCGDSYGGGTFSDGFNIDGMAAVACNLLGWDLHNVSIGGTGYLNPMPLSGGSTSLNAYDRLLPPANAWWIRVTSATAGTYTLTQGGVSVTLAYNANAATAKAAVDAAFGAGAFDSAGDGSSNLYLLGRGTNAATAAPMIADFSGLTGGLRNIQQWTGDLAPNVPLDGNGAALPFNLVLPMGHNDTTSTNAAYTPAALQAQVTSLLQGVTAKYPTARIFVVGNMYLPGGSVGSDVTTANAAIKAACQVALPKINGILPFIDTITSPWFTGTGKLGALTGSGNSDLCTDTDGVHPTSYGHRVYGTRIAREISQILGLQINP